MRPNGELPSDHCADRRRHTPELRRDAHRTVHRPSACSAVKALRNTSDAKAANRQAALAFRSLDPSRTLREPDRRRQDEERPSRSKQRTFSKSKRDLLTRKAPFKFESSSHHRRVHGEPDFFDDAGCGLNRVLVRSPGGVRRPSSAARAGASCPTPA